MKIIEEKKFQKNPLNQALRMEQNFRKIKELKRKFYMEIDEDSFTEKEISEAFDGYSPKIFEQELYPNWIIPSMVDSIKYMINFDISWKIKQMFIDDNNSNRVIKTADEFCKEECDITKQYLIVNDDFICAIDPNNIFFYSDADKESVLDRIFKDILKTGKRSMKIVQFIIASFDSTLLS